LDEILAMTIESVSWGDFHRLLGLDTPAVKNREKANIALTAGKAMGLPLFDSDNPNAHGWDYGNNKNFIVKHPKP
jgi:hypothetical protein